jgi:hypothetical protein
MFNRAMVKWKKDAPVFAVTHAQLLFRPEA